MMNCPDIDFDPNSAYMLAAETLKTHTKECNKCDFVFIPMTTYYYGNDIYSTEVRCSEGEKLFQLFLQEKNLVEVASKLDRR